LTREGECLEIGKLSEKVKRGPSDDKFRHTNCVRFSRGIDEEYYAGR